MIDKINIKDGTLIIPEDFQRDEIYYDTPQRVMALINTFSNYQREMIWRK